MSERMSEWIKIQYLVSVYATVKLLYRYSPQTHSHTYTLSLPIVGVKPTAIELPEKLTSVNISNVASE